MDSQNDKFPWKAILAACILTALTVENSHGADVSTQAYAVNWYVVTDVCKPSAGSPYQYAKNMNDRRESMTRPGWYSKTLLGQFFEVETKGDIVILTSYWADEEIGEYNKSHETYAISKAACETFIKDESARRQALAEKQAQEKAEAEKKRKSDSERLRLERERELRRRVMAGEKAWYMPALNYSGADPRFVCVETTEADMLRSMRVWESQTGLVTRWNPNYMDASGRYAAIEVMDGYVNQMGHLLAQEAKRTTFYADRQECLNVDNATERRKKFLREEFKARR
jgi:hypothetical protein